QGCRIELLSIKLLQSVNHNAAPRAKDFRNSRHMEMPMSEKHLSVNLDDLLLDIATAIDPSDADRRIMDRRYRRLKEHLERSTSPLAPFMRDDESRIYAQGSVAISATIISGDKDDRFDVDAIVEFDVPSDWSDEKALDVLFDALQGFPGAERIVRNTRCVT